MNRKGFTLVELLATLVVLGVVISIVVVGVNGSFSKALDNTEDIFMNTIKDAMDIYLSSDGKKLDFETVCSSKLNKGNDSVNVYKVTTTFDEVINSEYKPLNESDLINPGNRDVQCSKAINIFVNIYRDEDYVYYYSINKDDFGCLNESGMISSLPEGFDC